MVAVCERIANELAKDQARKVHFYNYPIRILFKYLEERGIQVQEKLSLSRDEVLDLLKLLNPRKGSSSLLHCICLNEILYALKSKELYDGPFLPTPAQVPRKLAVDLAEIPFELLEPFDKIIEGLYSGHSSCYEESLERRALQYLCEFLAAAMYEGAVSKGFMKRLFMLKWADVTFSPFSIMVPLSYAALGEEDATEQYAFFRYWLSSVPETLFLRLVLFLVKNRHKMKLKYDSEHIFPQSWRDKDKRSDVYKAFSKWTERSAVAAGFDKVSVRLIDFRRLAALRLIRKLPAFSAASLVGIIKSNSYSVNDLKTIDESIAKAAYVKINKTSPKRERKTKLNLQQKRTSIEKVVQANRAQLLADDLYMKVRSEIHEVLCELPLRAKRSERKAAGDEVELIMKKNLPQLNQETSRKKKSLVNLSYYAQWIVNLISNHELAVSTIQTWGGEIRNNFLFLIGNKALHEMSTDELVAVVQDVFELYDGSGISDAVKSFTDDLDEYQNDLYPSMQWASLPWRSDGRLRKERIKYTKPLIMFETVRAVLDMVERDYKADDAERYAAVIILGFYAGLRISEITNLTIHDLIFDGGYALRIRNTKSFAGNRDVPLSLLIPDRYLKIVLSCFERARARDLSIYPFTEGSPRAQSIEYSNWTRKIFEACGISMRFHHLRHAFANWLLVRWFVLTYGTDPLSVNSAFLKEEVFNEKYIKYLGNLLYGYNSLRKGQKTFSHVIAVLARLMGHAGPITSVACYVHIIDWMVYRLMRGLGMSLAFHVPNAVIEEFMQLTYPSLPASFKKRKGKTVQVSLLAQEQLSVLKRKMGQRVVTGDEL